MEIVELTVAEANSRINELIILLQDAVASGASLGFLPPLASDTARIYWQECIEETREGNRLILAGMEDNRIIGVVQLALATKPNAMHRAEVQKLCVLVEKRGRGVGRTMMAAVEEAARRINRSLLLLDTKEGDIAEQLYASCGYIRLGVIPHYTIDRTGTKHGTVFFYKFL